LSIDKTNCYMSKLISSLLLLCITVVVCGQEYTEKYKYKKRPSLGVHFTLHDFQTAADLKALGLGTVLEKGDWTKLGRMNPGLAFTFTKGLTDHLDVMTRLGFSFLDYPIPGKSAFGNDKLLIEADANLNLKLTSDKYWLSPFLTVGLGASQYLGYYGAYVPLGVGLQANLFDEAFIFINSNYRVPVTVSTTNNHLFHSVGIAGAIGKKKEVVVPPPPPPPVEVPKDTDQDGIIDADDACPAVAGLAQFKGCPDKDSDGIPDKDDKCPEVRGLPKYNGCPIPDTDSDGVNDEEDKCPSQKGLARYQGCPIPDKDRDGVNDEEDKCPDEPGPADNQGCPKLEQFNFNAKNVQFATGSATLLVNAKKELDELVVILNDHPKLNISIEGHTDNTGKPDFNQKLSQRRSDAVKAYLVKKGIGAERLNAAGFGQNSPIADNKTVKGRAENRRVEFKVSQ
jgi:OmpA-OmpF porin, OOP family